MDDVRAKLIECFQIVFPDLKEKDIPAASQDTVAEWDSVAAITLVNVIEEQFGIEMDLDQIAELDSFEKVRAHLEQRQQPA
ncbi:MAG: acyl carrier protein [Candidatus Korobacteraceae bacterium]